MKKQKKITALIASAAMMVASFGSAGVATLAWFTRGTEATATGFDFTASAAAGIQISTDPTISTSWKSNITTADFNVAAGPQAGNRISVPSMDPVSTVDAINGSGEFDFYEAVYSNDSWTINSNTEDYLVFDLYFQNQGSADLTLSLTTDSSVTDGANNAETSLSTRVGFIVEGGNNDPTTATTLAGGVSSYIWEPNSLTRSTTSAGYTGIADDAKYYYNGVSNTGSSITAVDARNHLSYDAGYMTAVNSTKDVAIGDSGVITVLPGGGVANITKVKVFVWMEGQDVDSNNSASEGDVNISLSFDSGDDTVPVEDATATAISDATTVTLSGATHIAATYSVFVFQTLNDSVVNLDYIQYYATGSATRTDTDITSITLDASLANGTYDVVVVGQLTGLEGSRTSTPLTY